MRIVADSHAIVWYVQGSPRLSERAAAALSEASDGIVVSVATLVDLWYVTQTTQGVTANDLATLRSTMVASPKVDLHPIDVAVADAAASILKFWADDWRSIIEAGAGYWRYVPTENGVRFLTRYDYRPRWARLGEVIDRRAVRPIFGWATAWSFDRLRLWLEKGIPPERSRNQAIAHAVASYGLAGMWTYHGR